MSLNKRGLFLVLFLALFILQSSPTPVEAQVLAMSPAQEELDAYLSYDEIVVLLREIERANPQIVDLITIGMSHGEDGDVRQTRDNREILAVKMSDRVDLEDDGGLQYEPDVLIIGGQHAREWISIHVPIQLIEFLVASYESDPKIKRLLSETEIWIVPLVNPDGYEFSRAKDRMWRKNRRDNGDGSIGVDLNRNFDYPQGLKWNDPLPAGTFTSIDSNFETYRGVAPFSEPESQAIGALVEAHDFKAALAIHNFGQTILYPWGVKSTPTEDHALLSSIAKSMTREIMDHGGAEYRPTQSYDPSNLAGGAYLKHGEISDWLYDQGVLAFTIELRPDSHAGGGFVLPIEQIDEVVQEIIPASLYLIEYTAEHFSDVGQFVRNDAVVSLSDLADSNQNGFIDDEELFEIVDYWVSGVPLGSSRLVIDNELFFAILDKWATGQPILVSYLESTGTLRVRRTSISPRQNQFRLNVEGQGIERIRLRIFNMAGEELLLREEMGSSLDFRLYDAVGHQLSNGTYLYTVMAFGRDGHVVTTQVEKFVVMRQGFATRLDYPSL